MSGALSRSSPSRAPLLSSWRRGGPCVAWREGTPGAKLLCLMRGKATCFAVRNSPRSTTPPRSAFLGASWFARLVATRFPWSTFARLLATRSLGARLPVSSERPGSASIPSGDERWGLTGTLTVTEAMIKLQNRLIVFCCQTSMQTVTTKTTRAK
jgi:hypothetical protein